MRSGALSLNLSPLEKHKAALSWHRFVSKQFAQGGQRPYGNRVCNKANRISAPGVPFSDRSV